MIGHGQSTKPFNIRLPAWAIEYIDQRSADRGITKTQVVVEALSRLRAEDRSALMRQGYAEMREVNRSLAEEAVDGSGEDVRG